MALIPRLELRQSQSLVMTPQLQQAIKLLQLSQFELRDLITAEIEQNPLLEMANESEDFPEDEGQDQGLAASDGETIPESHNDQLDPSEHPINGELPLTPVTATDEASDEFGETLALSHASSQMSPQLSSQASPHQAGGDEDPWARLAAPMRLSDHVWQQIGGILTDPKQRLLAEHFIDALDENGYCRLRPQDLAAQLGCEAAMAEAVLVLLQGCEPTGIFAASLAECLALQLAEKDELDPITQIILAHLDVVARHDWRQLERICGIPHDELVPYLSLIRAQNPRPASGFDLESPPTLLPDVVVSRNHEGIYLIELNPAALPRVLVNHRYYAEVQKSGLTTMERAFISEKFQAANFLVRALEQRATSMLKVATAIVSQQEAFFALGLAGFKPMTMAMIAAESGLSESTVSRITNQKYMLTPRGLFEMKYFFTAALAGTNGGEAVAAHSVRHRIKSLVEAETIDNVLSDDHIVKLLAKEGMQVARRTVAKYRDAMKIKSSNLRKREKMGAMEYSR